jgi:hypothetical protein
MYAMLALTIPVSKADIHLLPTFVQVCQHLGHFGKHRVIFIPTQEVAQDPAINLAVEHMKDVSDNVSVVPLKFTPEGGWPKACNMHFNATVPIGSSTGCNWYFCELDNTPLVINWLDILETDMNLAGRNYMGTVVPTRYKQGINGTHMVGCAIYAHDMAKTASLWKFCHAQKETPFDIYQRDELRPRWKASEKMQHMWGTVNYREVEGEILCDPDPKNPEGTDHSGKVRADVVVVHGCKDGSLAQLVISKPPRELEGATMSKPAQKILFSGNPGVWGLVKDKPVEAAPATVSAPVVVSIPSSHDKTPEQHFESLCEALGLFPEKQQDIYQMLLDRIPPPEEEKTEPEEEQPEEEQKPAPESEKPQETPAQPTPPQPSAITEALTEPLSPPAFPDRDKILEFRGSDKRRFTEAMDHFGIDRIHQVKFKTHLNDMGFIIPKAGWIMDSVPGQASFATA